MIKKNLKKLVATALMAVTVVSTVQVASAVSVSSWLDSPTTTAGTVSSRTKAERVYEASETAHAQNCYAKFDEASFVSLQGNFSDASRYIYVYLYDLDPDGDADDHVRTYLGCFSGRKLKSISSVVYSTVGKLEADGDNGAELYIKIKVDKLSGDPATPYIASGLFRYKVGMY